MLVDLQCAKLLSDVSVIQFYPSKFVLVTDILDTFGKFEGQVWVYMDVTFFFRVYKIVKARDESRNFWFGGGGGGDHERVPQNKYIVEYAWNLV